MRRATSALIGALVIFSLVTSPGGLAATGPRQRPRALPVPVVLVVFDELPLASLLAADGLVDGDLYPSFGALAGDSTWFRNTTAVASFTSDALPGILTGRRPSPRPLPLTRWYPDNIFRRLSRSHEIVTAEDLSFYCGPRVCPVTETHPPSEGGFGLMPATSGRGVDVARFIQELRPDRKPAVHFLHLVFPHAPWRYLPSGQRYAESDPIPGEIDTPGPGRGWSRDRWLVTQAYQRHLLQTALVDRILGRIVRRLRASGMYHRSLVAVVADHGISFRPGAPKRGTRLGDLGGVAHVPMFVKFPFQGDALIVDAPATTTDLVPTVLDRLDVRLDERDAARSLLRGPHHARRLYGERLADDPSALFETVARKHRLFDAGRPFTAAPRGARSLLGTYAWQYAAGEASRATATLTPLELASPNEPYFPSLLEGRLDHPSRSMVVVLVNERIVAVTRTYRGGRFYAMVPPRAFGPPPNDVALSVYEDGVLRPLITGSGPSERG